MTKIESSGWEWEPSLALLVSEERVIAVRTDGAHIPIALEGLDTGLLSVLGGADPATSIPLSGLNAEAGGGSRRNEVDLREGLEILRAASLIRRVDQ